MDDREKYEGAEERMFLAIESLAVSHKHMRERLSNAYLTLVPLRREDFPPHLRAKWNQLAELLTSIPEPPGINYYGTVRYTVSHLHWRKRALAARMIYELFTGLLDHNRYENEEMG